MPDPAASSKPNPPAAPYTARFTERVRSFHLDVYGHVNNAVFMQWFEHGRSQLLQDKGFTYTSIVDRWGVRLVTVATTINFRAQLHLDDQLEIATRVKRYGRSSVTYEQTITRDTTLAADGETTICFTDPAMKGSVPIPPEFLALYAAGLKPTAR
jgi:acyl-CoA thioester hydrolase